MRKVFFGLSILLFLTNCAADFENTVIIEDSRNCQQHDYSCYAVERLPVTFLDSSMLVGDHSIPYSTLRMQYAGYTLLKELSLPVSIKDNWSWYEEIHPIYKDSCEECIEVPSCKLLTGLDGISINFTPNSSFAKQLSKVFQEQGNQRQILFLKGYMERFSTFSDENLQQLQRERYVLYGYDWRE